MSRRSIPLAVGVVVAVAAAACFRGKLPARELYRLSLPTAPAIDGGDGAALPARAPGNVAITPFTAPGIYGGRSIVYRIGATEYGTYANREWAVPLGTMLGMMAQDLAARTPITNAPAVFDPASPHSYTYIWRGVVRELEEVDRDDHVFAAVRLDARLVRVRDDSVVWSGSYRLEREVADPTMPAIVETLSVLTTEVMARLLGDAAATLSASAASAAPIRPSGGGAAH